ncbi:MAG: class I SAM-dependent methyltransferase [Promethearchaeia archaeon]
MNIKKFYDTHKNFILRTGLEYFISPGIRCKFDLVKKYIGKENTFLIGVDLGCSGDSFLMLLEQVKIKCFLDISEIPLKQYRNINRLHPICADISNLPYRDNVFNFASALDVLEHVKDDWKAVIEISRILTKGGLAVITVPHRKKYYSMQDKIIGHYRRYESDELSLLFAKNRLKLIKKFGVYGKLMKISDVQAANPEKTESGIKNLREKYRKNPRFRKYWDIFVKISSGLMKFDARYTKFKKIRNIGLIFIKK